MGVIADARELANLIKKIGDLELYRRMVDLQGEVSALAGRNQGLEAELHQSKAALAQRAAMIFREPYYFVEGDSVPYCPKCGEADGKQVHLPPIFHWQHGDGRTCRTCQQTFMETRKIVNPSSWFDQYFDNQP